jgi:signal peptidase I
LAISRKGLKPDVEADQEAGRFHPTAKTPMVGAGRHSIIFSNVDNELRVWVDDTVVPFDSATTYDSDYDADALKTRIPTAADLSPLGIGTEGAALKVSHIKVLRDVYYIRVNSRDQHPSPPGSPQSSAPDEFRSFPDLANPEEWASKFAEGNLWPCSDIVLEPRNADHPEKDQFFVLGDNSAQSADGRLWAGEHYVERELFIGKALFIYWPHGWQIPYVPLPVNVVPYFGRMHLVR